MMNGSSDRTLEFGYLTERLNEVNGYSCQGIHVM